MKKLFLLICFVFLCADVYAKSCHCGHTTKYSSLDFYWQVADGTKCSSGVGAATMVFSMGDQTEITHTDVKTAQSYCGL